MAEIVGITRIAFSLPLLMQLLAFIGLNVAENATLTLHPIQYSSYSRSGLFCLLEMADYCDA